MKKWISGAALTLLISATCYGTANASWTLTNSASGDGYLGTPDYRYLYSIVGSDNGTGPNTTFLTTTATTAQTLSFRWVYNTFDCCGSYWDPAGYVVDGVETQLAGASAPDVDVNATYSGVVTFKVKPGDTYGFYVASLDSQNGPATIEFENGIPEPMSWALMMLGFAATGVILRRRRSDTINSAVEAV